MPIQTIIKSRIPVICILVLLLYGCCKKDKEVIIPPISDKTFYLTFEYKKINQSTIKIPEDISYIDVYIFNNKGILIKNITETARNLKVNDYKIPIRLPLGEYSISVWGSTSKIYQVKDKANPTQHELSSFNNLRLHLTENNTVNTIDNIYHGVMYGIQLTEKTSDDILIHLIKNTNTINVTVDKYIKNNSAPNTISLDVFCGVANGIHCFDNTIYDPETIIDYIPIQKEQNDEMFKSTIKTYRLLTGMKSHLTLKEEKTNNIIYSSNLIDLLLLLPEINTNQDFDAFDEYNIHISLNANIVMSISINGYIVINNDIEVE